MNQRLIDTLEKKGHHSLNDGRHLRVLTLENNLFS